MYAYTVVIFGLSSLVLFTSSQSFRLNIPNIRLNICLKQVRVPFLCLCALSHVSHASLIHQIVFFERGMNSLDLADARAFNRDVVTTF